MNEPKAKLQYESRGNGQNQANKRQNAKNKNRNWHDRRNDKNKREGDHRPLRAKYAPETIADFQKANELLEQEIVFEIGLISDIELDV